LSRLDIADSKASPSPQAGASGGGRAAEPGACGDDVALGVDPAALRCLTKYTLATATAAMTMTASAIDTIVAR
jgi:hypothetical protein